jgi:putative endonuclease
MSIKTFGRRYVKNEQRRHYIYVLDCGDDRYYTGLTMHLTRRMNHHIAGRGREGSIFTKKYPPWNLVHLEITKDYHSALKRESEVTRAIKNGWREFYLRSEFDGYFREIVIFGKVKMPKVEWEEEARRNPLVSPHP